MKKRSKTPSRTKTRNAAVATKAGAFTLPAECTTADAGALKEQLAKLLTHPQTVTLDIAPLQRIDTATLQMLAAFVRDRRADSLSVEWSGEATAFKNAVSLLGLTSLL